MIVPRYYEDLEMLHDNAMPTRAYYIPASIRKDDLVENRESSDRFQLLNGEWNFKFYKSICDVIPTDIVSMNQICCCPIECLGRNGLFIYCAGGEGRIKFLGCCVRAGSYFFGVDASNFLI